MQDLVDQGDRRFQRVGEVAQRLARAGQATLHGVLQMVDLLDHGSELRWDVFVQPVDFAFLEAAAVASDPVQRTQARPDDQPLGDEHDAEQDQRNHREAPAEGLDPFHQCG